LFAGLAPLGFVFQPLVVEEYLFTRSPDEILGTVYAFDKAVLIFTLVSHFQCLGGFRVCHAQLPWSVAFENIMPGRANKVPRYKYARRFATNEGKRFQPLRAACGQLVYNYGEIVSR
jgi:hypothetical protein